MCLPLHSWCVLSQSLRAELENLDLAQAVLTVWLSISIYFNPFQNNSFDLLRVQIILNLDKAGLKTFTVVEWGGRQVGELNIKLNQA